MVEVSRVNLLVREFVLWIAGLMAFRELSTMQAMQHLWNGYALLSLTTRLYATTILSITIQELHILTLFELRLRIGRWLALFLGGIFIVWAFAEKRAAVSFGDLYPGLSLIAASFVLAGLLKYSERPFDAEEQSDGNDQK